MSGKPRGWTRADIQELEDLYLIGYRLWEIAEIMNRHSRANIWAALRRFGIYKKHGHRPAGDHRRLTDAAVDKVGRAGV